MFDLLKEDPPLEDMLKKVQEKCTPDLINHWNYDSTPLPRQYVMVLELENLPAMKILQKLGVGYMLNANKPPIEFKTENTIFSRNQIAKKLQCNKNKFWGRLKLNYNLAARHECDDKNGIYFKPLGDDIYEVVLYRMEDSNKFFGAEWTITSANGRREIASVDLFNPVRIGPDCRI